MTIVETLRELLATLPKCCECDRPATRMFMSKHVAPTTYGGVTFVGFAGSTGGPARGRKEFRWRGYTGAAAGAASYQATDGVWEWDCCDDHEMPAPMGVWDKPMAATIRRAQTIIRSAAERMLERT